MIVIEVFSSNKEKNCYGIFCAFISWAILIVVINLNL